MSPVTTGGSRALYRGKPIGGERIVLRRRHRPLAAVLGALLLLGATNDPLADQQWHLRHVGAPEAWQAGRGTDAVVAVVDTGVDASHPDLRGRTVPGVDLVDRGTRPDDPNGHGTMVAGIVAATADNDRGGAGVAPDALVMPVRVLDENGAGTGSRVAEGIRWAARNGADVINLSLADAEVPGFTDSVARTLVTRDIEQAIAEAHEAGVVVVAAAGNEGRDDTPYRGDTPALVVGASDHADARWEDSNVDDRTLFAPGVEIVSTFTDHGYAKADGTSFSAPIVAGGAALLSARGLDADAIIARLVDTATPIDEGAGRVDLAAAAGVSPRRDTPTVSPRQSPTPRPTTSPRAAGSREAPVPIEAEESTADEPVSVVTAEPLPPEETEPPPLEIDEPPLTDDVAQADPPPPPSSLAVGSNVPPWLVAVASTLLAANLTGLAIFAARRPDVS